MAAIGIDLGTTNSCVAVVRDGKVQVLKNEHGFPVTPSCVAFSDADTLVGNAANFKLSNAASDGNVVHSIKRIIGQSFNEEFVEKQHWPFKVIKGLDGMSLVEVTRYGKKETFRPEEISALVLHEIKSFAEKRLGREVNDAVITVPARFTALQRIETQTAAKIAGLNVIGMINEPTAAALAYGLSTHGQGKRYVLVYDLGGGTFDVAVIKIKGRTYKIKGIDGDLYLGGDDFTNNLAEYFAQTITGRERGGSNVRKKDSWAKLRKRAEETKHQLSFETQSQVELKNNTTGKKVNVTIEQSTLNRLNKELYNRTMKYVNNALRKANIGKGEIKHVVLAGGSTRIPFIQTLVEADFPNSKIYRGTDPDEVVAQGAATLAAHLSGHATGKIPRPIYYEVASHSLGTDVCGGGTSVIIAKDSKLPAKAVKIYANAMDNQESIQISVCQGEEQNFSRNQLIDTFDVAISRDLAEKVKVEVEFILDTDGMLSVTATEKKFRKKKHKVEMALYGGFRDDQIKKMAERLQNIMETKKNDQR